MKRTVPSEIDFLFARNPTLCGFSVRDLTQVPDSCPRSGEGCDLFISDVGIAPALSPEQYSEIYEEITTTLAELLCEQPEVGEMLSGRTFARSPH